MCRQHLSLLGNRSWYQRCTRLSTELCLATNRKQARNRWVPVPWSAEGVAGGRPDSFLPACPLRQQHGNAGFLALRRLQFPAAGRASHWGRLQTGSLGPRLVAPVCFVFFFSLLSPVLHPSMLINLEFAAWERRDFRLDKRVRSNLIKPAVTPFGGNSSFRIIVLRFLLQSL